MKYDLFVLEVIDDLGRSEYFGPEYINTSVMINDSTFFMICHLDYYEKLEQCLGAISRQALEPIRYQSA